jgi:hypothetical protein
MKRYYLVPVADLPIVQQEMGEHHFLDLSSYGDAGVGWLAVVFCDESIPVPADVDWQAMPHLLDATETLDAEAAATLADVVADATHTGYTLAVELATLHPKFAP